LWEKLKTTGSGIKKTGSGIISLREVIESAQLRWYGHSVRVEDETYPKMDQQARTLGTDPKEDLDRPAKDTEDF
jgi:hypothetical protein